jgi:hypothetical protein
MIRQIILADRVLASDIELTGWAGGVAELTKRDHIAWCDGSYPEWECLTDLLGMRTMNTSRGCRAGCASRTWPGPACVDRDDFR